MTRRRRMSDRLRRHFPPHERTRYPARERASLKLCPVKSRAAPRTHERTNPRTHERAHLRFVAVIHDPTGFMPVGEERLCCGGLSLSQRFPPPTQGRRAVCATNRRCAPHEHTLPFRVFRVFRGGKFLPSSTNPRTHERARWPGRKSFFPALNSPHSTFHVPHSSLHRSPFRLRLRQISGMDQA